MTGRDDEQQWRDFVKEVTPLDKPAPPPAKKIIVRTPSRALVASADLRRPADRGHERRIRAGKVKIQARLDLHGYRLEQAMKTVPDFVAASRRRGLRCVLVITGKGRDGAGCLREALLGMLETTELGRDVGGYASAHRNHGGSGAVYLFLRPARQIAQST